MEWDYTFDEIHCRLFVERIKRLLIRKGVKEWAIWQSIRRDMN